MSRSMRDLLHNVLEATSLLPAVRTADANGSAVGISGYDSALVLVHIGAPGDTLTTSLKIQPRLEEADDDGAGAAGTFAAVAAADIEDASGAAASGTNGEFGHVQDGTSGNNGSQIIAAGYKGQKPWLRVVWDITGTHTNGTPGSATIVRGHPHIAPTR